MTHRVHVHCENALTERSDRIHIDIDCARADHLSCNGYPRQTTLNITVRRRRRHLH
jgi:hypothetical protein